MPSPFNPPKDLFLNLNYDILQSEKVKLDKEKRDTLIEASLGVVQDHFYNEMMTNMSKAEDPDRYYNWYHGYTEIEYPYYDFSYNQLFYDVHTSATSGNISSQYLNDKFSADKVEGYIYIVISVYVPPSVRGDNNVTLMLDVNKRTMMEVSYNDRLQFCDSNRNCTSIDAGMTHWSKNITAPSDDYYYTYLDRKVSQDEIRNMKLDVMPGFRLTWNYNKHVQPEAKYRKKVKTKEFVKWAKYNLYAFFS